MVAEKQKAPQPRDATVRRERVLPWYHSPCARKSATRCPMQGSCLNAARTGMLTLLVGSIWDAGSEGITDLPTRCAVAPPPRSLQAFDKRRLHHNYSSYYNICFEVCQEYARIFLLLRKKGCPVCEGQPACVIWYHSEDTLLDGRYDISLACFKNCRNCPGVMPLFAR